MKQIITYRFFLNSLFFLFLAVLVGACTFSYYANISPGILEYTETLSTDNTFSEEDVKSELDEKFRMKSIVPEIGTAEYPMDFVSADLSLIIYHPEVNTPPPEL